MKAIEHIARGNHPDTRVVVPGVTIRPFASDSCGAVALSTGIVTLDPGAAISAHVHPCSEAITVLEGEMVFGVEGRLYRLRPLDAVHVPAGVVHWGVNPSKTRAVVGHFAFGSARVEREFVEASFPGVECGSGPSAEDVPEHVSRHGRRETYPLAEGTWFTDLYAGRYGSKGICGGYGEFKPDTALPCHVHGCEESITIVGGEAACEVEGEPYLLSDRDTILIPAGRCHRFVNRGGKGVMAMIWVYATDEPGRTLVETRRCSG